MIWSLIGSLIHGLLEKAAEFTDEARAEERLFKEVLGKIFSGQYDLIELKTLFDYKVTSVWSVLGEPKEEWIAQANLNRLLLHEQGIPIDKLEIVCIIRDWQKAKAKFDSNYPNTQIKRIKLPVWTIEQAEQYLEERVKTFLAYEDTPDDDLPACSPKDRWQKPNVFAVYKDDKAKRASKLFDNPIEAEIHANSIGGKVVVREGANTRCEDYCKICGYCSFWKEKYGNES